MGNKKLQEQLLTLDQLYTEILSNNLSINSQSKIEQLELAAKRAQAAADLYGESHPEGFRRRIDYGYLLLLSGQTREAQAVFSFVIQQGRATLFQDHPLILEAQSGLARSYLKTGYSYEGKGIFLEVYRSLRRLMKLGLESVDTKRTVAGLALCCDDFDKFKALVIPMLKSDNLTADQSLSLIDKMIISSDSEITLSEDEVLEKQEIIGSLCDIGLKSAADRRTYFQSLFELEKKANSYGAVPILEVLLSRQISLRDDENIEEQKEMIGPAIRMVHLYLNADDYASAEQCYRVAMYHVNNHPNTSSIDLNLYSLLGEAAFMFGNQREAVSHLRKALDLGIIESSTSIEVSNLLHQLGTLLLEQKDYVEAEVMLTNALQMKAHFYDSFSAEMQLTLIALGHLYGSTGRIELAAEKISKALEVEAVISDVDSDRYLQLLAMKERLVVQNHDSEITRDTNVVETQLELPATELSEVTTASGLFRTRSLQLANKAENKKLKAAGLLISKGRPHEAVVMLEELLYEITNNTAAQNIKAKVLEQLVDACHASGASTKAKEYMTHAKQL
jgi:tetratricopeptide (TPR) repeat protein